MPRPPVAGLILAGAFVVAASAAPPQRSISTSRQFIVYGTDLAMRGAICDLAERTKRELLTLLEVRDELSTAIVINAQYAPANLPELPRLSLGLGQTGSGLKLQLDLVVNSGAQPPEIRRAVLRALLLEMMYRRQPNISAGATYISPPGWLLEGIPAEQSDLSRDRLSSLLALPVAAKNILSLEKFLGQRPELLDAAGRTLYQAYSFALVDLLRRSPDGPRRLQRFIAELPVAANDQLDDLRIHFPGLFESEVADKTWETQVARLSTAQPYQLMGIAETEQALAENLRIRISESGIEKRYDLGQFPIFLRSSLAKDALSSLAHDLSVLATRANPVYASIIAEYAELAANLARRKTAGIVRRLDRLRADRAAVTTQMRQIDDYLNWFEATSLARPSGEFADYMRAAERTSRPERTKRDPDFALPGCSRNAVRELGDERRRLVVRQNYLRAETHPFGPRLTKIVTKARVQKGYEVKRENRGTGGGRLYFAVASRSSDSRSAFVFSVARLHLGRGRC